MCAPLRWFLNCTMANRAHTEPRCHPQKGCSTKSEKPTTLEKPPLKANEMTTSQDEPKPAKEDFKFSFVRKSDDEYWVFAWRSWGAMLKTSAECVVCGKLPGFYWGEVNAEGKEGNRRMYACGQHFNEVFRMVLEL